MMVLEPEERPNAVASAALPAIFPDVDMFELASEDGQRSYQILVAMPRCAPPPDGFPTIYVLDGNADFLTVSEVVRRVTRKPAATGIAPAIVVGIGYPDTRDYHLERRYLDFTLSAPAESDISWSNHAYGGQADFASFLVDRLVPVIEKRFHANPACRTLLGHSLAGYFCLEAAARCPDQFSSYLAFSPSLWWDYDGLSRRLISGVLNKSSARFYLAVGRYEQERAPWQADQAGSEAQRVLRDSRQMVGNLIRLGESLTNSLGRPENVRVQLGEEEDHATILPSFLCRALRYAQGVPFAPA